MKASDYKKPNFFIIGGPKCGTTALSEYLRTHCDIFFSEHKEPYFFNDDLTGKEKLVGVTSFDSTEDYLEKEFSGSTKYKAVGEGTPMYLFSRTAVPNILSFNPDAKFIVMIRNPVDMAYSLHTQLLMGLTEEVRDFETAWRLQEERKNGKKLPKTCNVTQMLQYGEICKLGEQLERLYKIVPKERVLLIFYDDFRSDTKKEYIRTLNFLGLDYDDREDFKSVNISKRVKRPLLHRFVVLSARLKKKLGVKRSIGIARRLFRLYGKEEKRAPMSDELREELKDYFGEDIKLLRALTGRDLSIWR